MNDSEESIILVDRGDRPTGVVGKLEGHRRGLLHRAFSVIVDDGEGRLLLQRRHVGKYHSGGLWTNTCCSHPRPGEPVSAAARRRLREEMGFECPLSPVLRTIYRAQLDNAMIEHEYLHVFAGSYRGPVRPCASEADGYAWVARETVARDVEDHPERYSVWFRTLVRDHWDDIDSRDRRAS